MTERASKGPSRGRLLVAFYATPDEYPPTYSAVLELARHFDVRIVCREKADASLVAWPANVTLERVGPRRTEAQQYAAPKHEKLAELVGFVAALRRALRKERPEVVLAYEPHALVALKLAGCSAPVVYHRHEIEDLDRDVNRRTLQGWVLWASLRLAAWPALTVFPEKARADYYMTHARVRRPPVIVPNFPRLETFPPPSDWGELLARRTAHRELLFRGVVCRENGARELVEALAELPDDVSLRLCGRAPEAFGRELTDLAKTLDVLPRVDAPGYVPYEALNRQSLASSVGLALYHFVGSNPRLENAASASNKIYEYAACGLPTVVPDRPSFRAFLADESWVRFAEPTDARAIARCVAELIADPAKYGEIARAARSAFEERLHFEAAFAKVLDEMRSLARAPSRQGARPLSP